MEDFSFVRFDPAEHGRLMGELTHLLHQAYAPLAARGMRYLASHQPPETTLARLQSGDSFLGFLEDELVAAITVVRDRVHEPCPWYERPGVFYFTQFAVKTAHQGRGLGNRMMEFAENFARDEGAEELALDTSEHAHDLIAMYEKRQYRFIGYAQWEVTNYRSVILSKALSPGSDAHDEGSEGREN